MPKCKSINRKCNSIQLWLYNFPFRKYFFLLYLNIFKTYSCRGSESILTTHDENQPFQNIAQNNNPTAKGVMLISRGRRTDGVNTYTGTCSTQKMKIAFFCLKKKSPQKQSITARHEISLVNIRLMPKTYITRFNFFQAGYRSLLHIPLEQLKMAGRKCSNQDV